MDSTSSGTRTHTAFQLRDFTYPTCFHKPDLVWVWTISSPWVKLLGAWYIVSEPSSYKLNIYIFSLFRGSAADCPMSVIFITLAPLVSKYAVVNWPLRISQQFSKLLLLSFDNNDQFLSKIRCNLAWFDALKMARLFNELLFGFSSKWWTTMSEISNPNARIVCLPIVALPSLVRLTML